jgi:hypothetical protein
LLQNEILIRLRHDLRLSSLLIKLNLAKSPAHFLDGTASSGDRYSSAELDVTIFTVIGKAFIQKRIMNRLLP